MRRSATILRTFLFATLSATVVVGQKGEIPPDDPQTAPAKKAAEIADHEIEGEGEAAVANIGGPRNAAMVSAQIATQPRRLARGESGRLLVIVALSNPAVITAGTPISLQYEPEQDGVLLGSFQVHPAEPGTLATKFRGSPVYDNTVTLELPITVKPDAEAGQRTVSMSLVSQLTHAATGNDLGEVRIDFGGRIKVGRPLPNPGVAASVGRPAIGTGASAAAPEGAAPAGANPTASSAGADTPKPRVRGSGGVRAAAVGVDGVALDLVLPDDAVLVQGSVYELSAILRVPEGQVLCRDAGSEPGLTIEAGSGVEVVVGSWPPSGRAVEVPVQLTVAADAANGMRELKARATYRLAAGDGPPGDETTLSASAILAVGSAGLGADPSWFWVLGGAFALVILVVVVRVSRR